MIDFKDCAYELDLDLSDYGFYPKINMKQYDVKSRFIKARLYNDGLDFNVNDKDLSFKIIFKKPDGKVVFKDCTVMVDGQDKYVLIPVNANTLAVDGIITSELVIMQNDEIFSTKFFYINCLPSLHADKNIIESNDEYDGFLESINKVEEMLEEFKELDSIVALHHIINVNQNTKTISFANWGEYTSNNDIEVFLSGVKQIEGIDFTVDKNAKTITALDTKTFLDGDQVLLCMFRRMVSKNNETTIPAKKVEVTPNILGQTNVQDALVAIEQNLNTTQNDAVKKTGDTMTGNLTMTNNSKVIGNLQGNADTATKLQTPRNINGVEFDGTKDIVVEDDTKVRATGNIVNNRVAIFNDATGKVIKDSGFTIETSVPPNALFTDTVYVHPPTHSPNEIATDANNRFVTDVEKQTWNDKETTQGSQQKADKALNGANAYTDAKVIEVNQYTDNKFNESKQYTDNKVIEVNRYTDTKFDESKQYTDTKVADLVDSAPDTLDTLKELAEALGNDPNFATTVATQIGQKADKTYVDGQLANKANVTDVTNLQNNKADKTELTNGLATKADLVHTHTSNQITAMTNYAKPNTTSAIGQGDSLNVAIGKLERALDDKQASGNYLPTTGGALTGNLTAPTFIGALQGNATTATTLQTARNIGVNGDATGSVAFNGSQNVNIPLTLANSGVQAGSYGATANANTNVVLVPQITVDAKGRITTATTRTITVPQTVNTDTMVTNALNNTTRAYVTGTTSNTTNTGTQIFDSNVYLDTTAGHLTATQFNGRLNGNATTATTLQTTREIRLQGDVTGTANFNGGANAVITSTLANVTRNNTTSNQSPNFGTTFTAIDSITTDTKGRITGVNTKTVTLPTPAQANDTNVTNTPNNTVQAYITGTTTATQSTGTQVFDTGVYLTTNAGELRATTFTGNLTGNVTGSVNGNATTATRLQTPRTITISGAVNGNASFDGSQNITINTTNNIKVNIQKIKTKVQLTTNQQTVAIGTVLQANDIVDVFLSGVRLEEGTHYTLNRGANSISSVAGTTSFIQGDYFNFEVLRATVTV